MIDRTETGVEELTPFTNVWFPNLYNLFPDDLEIQNSKKLKMIHRTTVMCRRQCISQYEFGQLTESFALFIDYLDI